MESIDKGIRLSIDNVRTFIMTNDFAQYKLGSSELPDDQFIGLVPAVSVSFKNVTNLRKEQDELLRIKLDKASI